MSDASAASGFQRRRGRAARAASARRQLDGFISRFSPEVAATARAALKKLRALLPGAVELVYDNYNTLAIGFSPTERASDAVFSLALYPRYVNLCFLQGANPALPDPHGLLHGSGTVSRFVRLADEVGGARFLDDARVRALIEAATTHARVGFDGTQKRRLVIKSVASKQRPRRPSVRAARR